MADNQQLENSTQQTKADRYVHAFQHARSLTMRKGISFGTADMGAKVNSFKVTQKIVPGDAYHAATCLMQAMLQDNWAQQTNTRVMM